MKLDSRSFAGKTVFIGIDVHKATYSVVAVCEGDVVLKIGSMPASADKLLELMKKRFADARLETAYEAGFSGFGLCRSLRTAGVGCLVVHAASIEVAANDRVKTDKRDATKIALHLARGALKGIRVPSLEEELRRQLTRTRFQLIKERTRLGNKIKSKLFQFGYIEPTDDRVMSGKLLKEIRRLPLPSELSTAIGIIADLWEAVQQKVEELDDAIDEQAKKEPQLERIYRSTPGVGRLIARTLANEIGDMSQFRNARELYSFVGLTPAEYSSGPNERKGHITKQGSGLLRCLLVEAAWMAKTKDPALAAVYDRLKITRGGKRAIVAVARRLVGRIRSCLQTGTPYELNYRGKCA